MLHYTQNLQHQLQVVQCLPTVPVFLHIQVEMQQTIV